MKIPKSALLSFILGSSCSAVSSAFAPSHGFRCAGRGTCGTVTTFGTVLKPKAFESMALVEQPRGLRKHRLSLKITPEGDIENFGDDDDDEGPLSDGIDSVSWLPTVKGARSESTTSVREGAELLPLFPLGGIVYTPNSEHVLNIFEPRYRQMYNDILMNGTKRFVVAMSHPTQAGRFAETGVLFELEDLKEVSEQTDDRIKYICNHRVTGRVKLHRILNPEAWESRETYLKAEGTITDDTANAEATETGDVYAAVAAASKSAEREEDALRKSFSALVDIQHELQEDVRFTRASTSDLAVAPGSGEDGLWQTIKLWQSYAEQRLVARQNELQMDFQQKLKDFLTKDRGMKDEELPSAIGFQDLSPALQQEVQDLQKRMTVELEPLVLESTLTMQKLLEAEDHKSRCNLLRYFIDAERKRLNAKKTLQGMFTGASAPSTAAGADSAIPPEENIDKEDDGSDDEEDAGSQARSIFTDEPDAFQ